MGLLIHHSRWMLLGPLCVYLLGTVGVVQGELARESDRRAACIYKLAEFVDWPEEAFRPADAPIIIGVLGADPFGKVLDGVVQNEVVKNRKLVVQRYRRVEEISTCNILFISQSEGGRLEQILSMLKGKNILTVGESESFARRGGMVRFLTEKNKLRMRINVEAAKAANLTISSKLLRIADLVGADGESR